MEILALFTKYLAAAGAITCDDGVFVTDWESADQIGDPDNQVLILRWYEGSQLYGHTFTEGGIAAGKVDSEGKFVVQDDEGDFVSIRFYRLDRLVNPDAGDSAAIQFFDELLAAHETLTGIADLHGALALANLLYLQQAILKNTHIELTTNELVVREIVASLPSASRWLPFIR